MGYTTKEDTDAIPIEETLAVLVDLIKQGKVRHVGISNESPWGAMRYLRCAEAAGLPRIVSIQNPYNLLNRSFEIGLAEIALRERCGLLAYSPLAMGVLSGKYLNGQLPDGARLQRFPDYTRYSNPESNTATAAYVRLARDHGLDPAQMALAYVNSRPFLSSNLIGATNMDQLKHNIASIELELSPEVIEGIEAIHIQQPNPAP